MNRNLVLVLVGCAGLLVVCCVLSVVTFAVAGTQINQLVAQTTGQLQPSQLPESPTVPDTSGTNPFPSSSATSVPSQPSGGLPNVGDLFGNALNKGKTATKYRVQFNWIFGGMDNGKYSEQPFFDFTGEVDGQNTHLVSKGGFMAMLGGDQNANIEIIEADGKTYMKGITMFGMTDPKVWYIQTDNSTTSGFSDFTKPDYFSGFTSDNTSDYKKVRSESLDGQSCDVYLYDMKSLQNSALIGLLGSAQDKTDFSAIDKAEMNVWLCGDGYVHQFTMDYEGHNQSQPDSKAAMKMNIHLWDYNNSSIKVVAPSGAKPMPN
jgi:hypothetical protein